MLEPIDKKEKLNPGDKLRFVYKLPSSTMMQAATLAFLEGRLDSRPDFEVVSWSTNEAKGELSIDIKVKEFDPFDNLQKAGVSAGTIIVSLTVVTAGVLAFLSLKQIYKIVDEPAGKVAVGGFGVLAACIGLFFLIKIVKG